MHTQHARFVICGCGAVSPCSVPPPLPPSPTAQFSLLAHLAPFQHHCWRPHPPTLPAGVDGGTESIRAGVFDLAGTPLSFASVAYPTAFPAPGWAEQDPADWWAGLGTAVRQAVASASIQPCQVAALSVDSTCCTVVALDARGQALRPALLWMDMRSAAQAARVAACGDEALGVNGGGAGPVSAEWMVPKVLWLRESEPEVFEAAAGVCEYQVGSGTPARTPGTCALAQAPIPPQAPPLPDAQRAVAAVPPGMVQVPASLPPTCLASTSDAAPTAGLCELPPDRAVGGQPEQRIHTLALQHAARRGLARGHAAHAGPGGAAAQVARRGAAAGGGGGRPDGGGGGAPGAAAGGGRGTGRRG